MFTSHAFVESRLMSLFRYAEAAAPNAEQTSEQASAPASQAIIPDEGVSSDAASYSTGGIDDTSSSTSAPSGAQALPRSNVSDISASDQPVFQEPGPSISVNPPAVYDDYSEGKDAANGSVKHRERFSPKEEQLVVFSGVGTLNLLALGAIGYWSYKRYTGGENVWKILGFAAGAWVGLTAFEWLSVRYAFGIVFSNFSAFDKWTHKKTS